MRFQNRHPAFSFLSRHESRTLALAKAHSLKKGGSHLVECFRGNMRGMIAESISLEEFQALRCLRAVEGYVDLGMFEEADEELRELDPAWFSLEATVSLQLRVLAGLSQRE